jgi:hypothetical protein
MATMRGRPGLSRCWGLRCFGVGRRRRRILERRRTNESESRGVSRGFTHRLRADERGSGQRQANGQGTHETLRRQHRHLATLTLAIV